MPDSIPPVKRALVLSGGGGRGAYQVGVWRRLQEVGWQPDLVCGTSIGSLNGALICSGYTADRMEHLWKTMHNKKVFSLSLWGRLKYWIHRWLGRHPNWPALMESDALRELLTTTIDVHDIRRNSPRLVVSATNIRRAMVEYFTGEQLDIVHLVASCSIPLVFPWCEIEGEYYWDGGVLANTPVFPALEAGASDILVVMLSPSGGQVTDLPRNTEEAVSRMFDIVTLGSAQSLNQGLALQLGRDLRSHAETLSQQHFMDMGGIRVGLVAPRAGSSIAGVMDLDPVNIESRIAAGYQDAVEQLSGFLNLPTGGTGDGSGQGTGTGT